MIERYSRRAMAEIWDLQSKFGIWLDIEIAACEAQQRLGMIPLEALRVIKEKASFDVGRILEIEERVHHDVIAFLTSVAEAVGPESRYIHLGMTSSDIGDTALAIQMARAGKIILEGLDILIGRLRDLALKYRNVPCMGRTHGVHAEPTTFGLKMAIFYKEFQRNHKRVSRAVESISCGKISGAVGNFSSISPGVEEYVCAKFGLAPEPVSNQIVQRDRHAEYLASLAIAAGSLDKLSTEIRHLQRTEVREVEEPFRAGQKGSSAMPHKRNPVMCERISGMARVIKSNVNVALENMTLWHERDISHSSAERIVIADSTIAIDYLIHQMIFILENLIVYPDIMMQNLNRTGGLYHSQALLLKMVEKGMTREEAYAIVQEISMQVWDGKGGLKELSLSDRRISGRLTGGEIEEIFTMDGYLKNVDYIFKRAGLD